jgi:hypothetical protein
VVCIDLFRHPDGLLLLPLPLRLLLLFPLECLCFGPTLLIQHLCTITIDTSAAHSRPKNPMWLSSKTHQSA